MARQQIERLDFEDRSRITNFQMDRETGSRSDAGIYFKFSESCQHMAAAITRNVADTIRPRDHFFGSYARTASFTLADRRFAWVGVMAGIAGLATLLAFGWSEIGAGAVSATERRADPSGPAAVPLIEAEAGMEAIRRRGLELLRADVSEDEPYQSLARGDRLEPPDAIKPVMRVATAGEDNSVAAPAPLPTQPAASKPAKAKEKNAAKQRQARRASRMRLIGSRWQTSRTRRSRPSRRPPQPADCRRTGRRRRRTSRSAGSGDCRTRSQAVGKTCGRKEMAVEICPAIRLQIRPQDARGRLMPASDSRRARTALAQTRHAYRQ